MGGELERKVLAVESWPTTKIGTLSEVYLKDGRIKYQVQVVDKGREKPHIDQMFTHEEEARDFLYNRLIEGGTNQETTP